MGLFELGKFRDAAEALEEAARLIPDSAPVHYTLGLTYSQIAGEYGSVEEEVRPWAKKSRDCLKKAVDLAMRFGGLNEDQLSLARESVTGLDRLMEEDSPPTAEDQRRKIFADFGDFRLKCVPQEPPAAATSPSGFLQSIARNTGQADATAYAKTVEKYGLSESQIKDIVEEGKQKGWPSPDWRL